MAIPPEQNLSESAGQDVGVNVPSKSASTPAGALFKPRVWPLFVVLLVVFLALVLLQAIAGAVLVLIQVAGGEPVDQMELADWLRSAPVFVMNLILAFLCMAGGATLFGWLSARRAGCSLADRLGLRWRSFSLPSLVVFLLGSVPVFMLSLGAVYLVSLVFPPGGWLPELYRSMTTPWAIVFIMAIGVFPGIGEELLFRGYVQRRMLQRCGPWVAIGVTSILFGLVHVTPQGIALATILGVWLGLLAWRTDSIWPSACCHAFVNSGWNVYQVGRLHWGIPEVPPLWFSVIGGGVVLAAGLVSLWILAKLQPGSTA